jgi:hypothetical protein
MIFRFSLNWILLFYCGCLMTIILLFIFLGDCLFSLAFWFRWNRYCLPFISLLIAALILMLLLLCFVLGLNSIFIKIYISNFEVITFSEALKFLLTFLTDLNCFFMVIIVVFIKVILIVEYSIFYTYLLYSKLI